VGKDYKIGLICGLVAAVAAVIWLATRPSLNSQTFSVRPAAASASAEKKPPAAPKPTNPISTSSQVSPARPQTTTASEPLRTEPPRVDYPRPSEPVPVAPRQASPPAPAPARTHVVQNGDTLSSIAQQYYGNPNAWQRIYKANAAVIKNPDRVPPGTKLTIP
jgi:nucleoid-associated protein YgaU